MFGPVKSASIKPIEPLLSDWVAYLNKNYEWTCEEWGEITPAKIEKTLLIFGFINNKNSLPE